MRFSLISIRCLRVDAKIGDEHHVEELIVISNKNDFVNHFVGFSRCKTTKAHRKPFWKTRIENIILNQVVDFRTIHIKIGHT